MLLDPMLPGKVAKHTVMVGSRRWMGLALVALAAAGIGGHLRHVDRGSLATHNLLRVHVDYRIPGFAN